MTTKYIVWNEEKTEGFATKSKQLAYEVRKGSDTNCYDDNGSFSIIAVSFIDKWGNGNCTIEEV